MMLQKERAISYYNEKLAQHGAGPTGMDWNSAASQQLRFDQLLKAVPLSSQQVTLLDFGCGSGALADYIAQKPGFEQILYTGYDASPAMIDAAKSLHPHQATGFLSAEAQLATTYDVVVASGLLNVKNEFSDDAWKPYCLDLISSWNARATKAFAFNVLTAYSDADKKRPHLYYAEPAFYFDYCKRHFSRNVALLHDYDLYEFTLIVRK
jgi:cyclopropane fatty-acyl-phospholipid synthase-like methyltransferase